METIPLSCGESTNLEPQPNLGRLCRNSSHCHSSQCPSLGRFLRRMHRRKGGERRRRTGRTTTRQPSPQFHKVAANHWICKTRATNQTIAQALPNEWRFSQRERRPWVRDPVDPCLVVKQRGLLEEASIYYTHVSDFGYYESHLSPDRVAQQEVPLLLWLSEEIAARWSLLLGNYYTTNKKPPTLEEIENKYPFTFFYPCISLYNIS